MKKSVASVRKLDIYSTKRSKDCEFYKIELGEDITKPGDTRRVIKRGIKGLLRENDDLIYKEILEAVSEVSALMINSSYLIEFALHHPEEHFLQLFKTNVEPNISFIMREPCSNQINFQE